ncbi:hypothetical protein CDN99_24210 [Roseateles aquatilis]|uniref:Uncharacterized protein n=1 Tax=Roseateles aquatilis TaxID=431061 RepID=A0A246IW12_9BURK|nr:contractile injection system tape measure protein [Roseateles aquatilis]OWQ84403.1 hypothetical protein CDN99_24210 [Roseateles aquatilis]
MTTHRIETLRWDLRHRNALSATGAQDLHQRLMLFLRRQGLAGIETCFDRACPPDQVWILPTLTLDLGTIDRHQSERQWEERLTTALRAALAQAAAGADVQPPLPMRRSGEGPHEVAQFLHYLRHGHLPWGRDFNGRQALSTWLTRLARQHGAGLWRALLHDPARDRLLVRLSLISPHDGLQALIAQRDPDLATTLRQMDDEALLPLQGSGRLSAYQRGQLQQALRVAALRQLWGRRGGRLSAHGRRDLLTAWRRLLAEALGTGWRALMAASTASARTEARARRPDGDLLHELLAADDRDDALRPVDARADVDGPGRTWEHALLQLQTLLRQRRPAQGERLRRLLTSLAAAQPALLRQRLQGWASQRRERRTWSLALEPASMSLLLAAMSPRPLPGLSAAAAPHWAESLRQTALRLQREAPAGQRPGLGRLRALLMQASLRQVLEGRRLPDQHQGWQALWRQAWQDWQGRGDDGVEAPRPRASPATKSDAEGADDDMDARDASATPPPRRRRGDTAKAADATDRALLHLERECRDGRWSWPQRLRLARLLETPDGCDRWLRLFSENRRWRMLQAQFGAMAEPLRQRAGRLGRWLQGLVREPVAALAEHWRRLCRHLFIQGLSPDAASLRRNYQDEALPASPPASMATGPAAATRRDAVAIAVSNRDPIWVDDAGQVLLAAYAERLFKHLNLLRDGRFIDAEAQSTAVQCLQTLCHGPGPADESCTVLSRLLCGAPPDEVLPPVPPCDAERLALLEQLLAAVVAHWKAVGNTTVAGLRESFLQRQGRLQEDKPRAGEPPRWRLRVQPRGFDVLLDRLPWSFHTIRLPWMPGVLHVEWR